MEVTAPAPGTFANPVLPGFHPDPSICLADGRFYLVTSSFEYFPGLPLFVSDNLVTWVQLGHVLERPSQLDLSGAPASGGLFAPTIRYHDGTFYVTCTNVSAGGHFVVTSQDPPAGWSDPVWIDQNGIDPSLHFEGDSVYFTSNVQPDPGGVHEEDPSFQRGIQQSLIDVQTGAILEGPRFIWAGTGARYPEAPHLFRRDGWYYLLIAEGGTALGHIASVGRSRSAWGPFVASPHGPVIDHRSIVSPFGAMGHADLVELSGDDWWAVCLGIRTSGDWPHHVLGRETFLAPVTWTPDGWPVVGDHGKVEVTPARPRLARSVTVQEPVRDHFDDTLLGNAWNSLRGPLEGASLELRPGSLTLRAAGRALEDPVPCFIGRRQTQHRFRAATSILLEAPLEGDEAGLMMRMNETHYYAIGVRRSGDALEVVLRQRFGHIDLVVPLGSAALGAEVEAAVVSDGEHYFFTAADSDIPLGAPGLDVQFLSTEVAGGFTGVYVGLYATSRHAESGSAHFDWFDYASEPSAGFSISA